MEHEELKQSLITHSLELRFREMEQWIARYFYSHSQYNEIGGLSNYISWDLQDDPFQYLFQLSKNFKKIESYISFLKKEKSNPELLIEMQEFRVGLMTIRREQKTEIATTLQEIFKDRTSPGFKQWNDTVHKFFQIN